MSLSESSAKLVDALVISVQRRQIVGSLNVALATGVLIQNVVRSIKYNSVEELIAAIKAIGRRLSRANPRELAAGNIIRRIVKLIREEYRIALMRQPSAPPSAPETPFFGPTTPGLHAPSNHYLSYDMSTISAMPAFPRQASLSNFVAMRHSRAQLERAGSVGDTSLSAATTSLFTSSAPLASPGTYPGSGQGERRESTESLMSLAGNGTGSGNGSTRDEAEDATRARNLRPFVSQVIDEVLGELDTTHDDVAKEANEHIHSSEVILTMGHSRTVEAFLKHAFKDRKFTVIVTESAPSYTGHKLASALTAHGIPTLLIPDSSVHALVPRCTKLILGAHSVLANGGVFALSGSLATVLAARSYAKPVVVLSGQFKFAPVWNSYHEYSAVDFQGPDSVLGHRDCDGVEVVDPYYDYIRPELVNLFVTNEGDHSPSYIYRIIKEAYDDEDLEL